MGWPHVMPGADRVMQLCEAREWFGALDRSLAMHATTAIILSLLSIPLCAQAAQPGTTLTLSCNSPDWPAPREVARYLAVPEVTVGAIGASTQADRRDGAGVDAQVRDVSRYIRVQGRRECWRGATHLLVAFYPERKERVAMVVRRDDATP